MRNQMSQHQPGMPMQFPYNQLPPGYQFHQQFQQQIAMQHTMDGHGRVTAPVFNQYAGMPVSHAGMQYGMYGPGMQATFQPHQYMPQQMIPQQHPPHQQMPQHSAHSSPTPPIHQQQQQQQQQPPQPQPQQQAQPQQQQQPSQPQPHQPKPKSKGIVIKDPNSNKEVDLATLAATPASTTAGEPTETLQNKERRNTFKEQVLQSVHQKGATPHTAPHSVSPAPKSEPRAPTPVEMKKPPATTPSPAKPVAQPVAETKNITPKSILPRTNSLSDDKTPEKQGVEMSVQTTPSLKKLSQVSPVANIPSQPTFTSPPKVEEKAPELKEDAPSKKEDVPSKKEDQTKADLSAITTISDKLDGEAIIIDNSSKKEPVKDEIKEEVKPAEKLKTEQIEEVKQVEKVKEKPMEEVKVKPAEEAKVNGVVEKPAERLTIEIPNGEEITPAEDVPSSEESSECKDQFETPPATPSEVRPEVPNEPAEPAKPAEVTKPVKAAEPVKPVEAVKPVKTEKPVETVKSTEPVKTVEPEVKEDKKEVESSKTESESSVPAKIVLDKEELEEGEIEEEEDSTPTGPFRYSREDMLVLREAQDKILPGVPHFDCIMDRPILKAEPTRPRPNNQFVPAWEQSGSRNKSRDHRNRSMDKNHSMGVMKPRIIEHTLAPVVTRKKSSNAWLSKREDGTKKDPKKVPDLKVLRGNIVAILNKITPQNFKDLSVQILQLQIDNKEKLEIAVEIIFEKAVLEPAFSQTYANLCKIMGSIKFPEEQNAKVSPFRKTLLNRCQKEFFREKSDEDKLTKQMEELQARTDISDNEKTIEVEELMYQRSKLKKKMLGNINFIGELFNLGMLSSKIIISQCIGNLLAKRDEGKLDDEVIECLAKLFSTVGLKLENECDDEMKKRAFEKSFSDFKDLGQNSNYAYRIRFMIQDVVELRENNWVPRRMEARPQRIEDIHREHAKEEQQKKMEAAVAASSRKSKSRADSRDERGRGSRDGRMDKHEFNIQPKRVSTNIDMNKLSGANQKVDSGNLILGPSRAQWGRGSGTGSGTNSPLSGSKEDLSTNNRFDMLTKKANLVPGRTSSAPAPRKMMERERANALASAQAIGRGGKPGRRTPSQSPVRSAEKTDPLSDEEIRKKTKSILMEYFDIEEIEEACACIKDELQLVKKHHVFVQESIDLVMEAKPKSLRLLGELFPALFQEDPPLMTADGLLTGFQPVFEVAQDLAIDVPAVYANFGKLLGQTFAKGHLSFKVIKGALAPLRESDKAGLVMCEIIKNALEVLDDKGSMDIQQRWGKDKMSWSDISDNPSELIQKYKLDFLSTTSEPKESVSQSDIDITVTLRSFFEDSASSQNDVFDYINKTVPEKALQEGQFIRDLMSVACDFCIEANPKSVGTYELSEDNFAKVTPILKKYLQSGKDNSELELHALDAAQLLIHEMKHPRDLAYMLFSKLEDDYIITENGFRHWRDHGKEQQGHGVMRQNLKSFFEDLSQDSADDSEGGS